MPPAKPNILLILADDLVISDHAKSSADKPLLLYFAPTAPYTPWLPSSEFQSRSPAGMYGDFTMMVDAMIGRVLQALDDARLVGNTLLIFTSDNGPVWHPEDVKRTGHDSVGGLRDMKSSHWEGGHRMPFVVRWPGRIITVSASRPPAPTPAAGSRFQMSPKTRPTTGPSHLL